MTGLTWRKSSWSGGNNDQCVELACAGKRRFIRDSKNPEGPVLTFSAGVLRAALLAWPRVGHGGR